MYQIAALNKISPKGTVLFTENYKTATDSSKADAYLVRSQDMHEMTLPKSLLAIARAGAGVNNIPIERCSQKGIVVFNTPGANANAVKELVLSSILMAARNMIDAVTWTRGIPANAAQAVEKYKSRFAGEEIAGKRLGVVGLGNIGVMVANAAETLGMRVVGYDPYMTVQNAHDLSPSVRIYESLETLLPLCDYVTIHVPAMSQTVGMFNYQLMDSMKNKAVLLNFSRDTLVETEALRRVLAEKKLRLYVTDFPIDELLSESNVVLIPHLGASTKESEENCAVMAVTQLMNYLEDGTISNSVNFPNCAPGHKNADMRVCILNQNIPNMLGKITGAIASMNLNINKLINKSKGDNAYTVIDIDGKVSVKELKSRLNIEGVVSVRFL
ncbi:MAG: 3-phosphoglycerate dehydrogenase [Clostridiales Family XIII bacterium]|jgi:D-3-phosphoglycerate dehydrogenase|nr:3-phosphoglycerate dehydrogenase [Clostridiales Family XIII bacterium]